MEPGILCCKTDFHCIPSNAHARLHARACSPACEIRNVHWPILEDLFYDVKHRFHYFTDLVSIMGRARRGSIMIVTDDDYQTPCDEEYDVEYAATRPGNSLEGWHLVRGPTTHHFSQGLRNIYVYKCIETLDSGTLEMLEELRDDEEATQKRLRELEEDAVETNI